MSKKFLSLISVLFLVTVLAVSCSNADKTGDGGTTTQGIAKYAGTWQLTPTTKQATIPTITIIISNNGSVTFDGETSTNVTDKGNETYEVIFKPQNEPNKIYTLNLKFDNDTSGTFSASDGTGTGTITKQQ